MNQRIRAAAAENDSNQDDEYGEDELGPQQEEGFQNHHSRRTANDYEGIRREEKGGENDNIGDGTIYIRADGKKVRRVKKTTTTATRSSIMQPSTMTTLAPEVNHSEASTATTTTIHGDLNSSVPSFDSNDNNDPNNVNNNIGGDGEIYIRADGKKVRRVVRKKTSAAAATTEDTATTEDNQSNTDGLLERGDYVPTIDGDPPLLSTPTSGPSEHVDFYIRADGKKVRRVKKVMSSSLPVGEKITGPSKSIESNRISTITAAATPSAIHPTFLSAESASENTHAEIYIRADGKKVRRVRKESSSFMADPAPITSSAAVIASVACTTEKNVNENEDNSCYGNNSSSETPVRAHSLLLTAPPFGSEPLPQEGEIYIRADGKKVRRVRKVSSSMAVAAPAPISSSESVITSVATAEEEDQNEQDIHSCCTGNISRSATPVRTHSPVLTTTPIGPEPQPQEGEIYIRADGKKVRRVRKLSSSSLIAVTTPAQVSSLATSAIASVVDVEDEEDNTSCGNTSRQSAIPELHAFLPVEQQHQQHEQQQTTTSEIYIRADGKKVRRVRKVPSSLSAVPPKTQVSSSTASGIGIADSVSAEEENADDNNHSRNAATPAETHLSLSIGLEQQLQRTSEIYIRPDGKKVRRIKKSSVAGSLVDRCSMAEEEKEGINSYSNISWNAATPTNHLSLSIGLEQQHQQTGEIYIRADGKKVRRVKKSSVGSLGDNCIAIDAADNSSASVGGPATVTGDRVIRTTEEGEIVIRADGKKVLRRKKKDMGDTYKNSDDEGEVFRREDGKLVRRIKRLPMTGDLADFLDEKARQLRPVNDNALASDDQQSILENRSTTPNTIPLSDYSDHHKEASISELPISIPSEPQHGSKHFHSTADLLPLVATSIASSSFVDGDIQEDQSSDVSAEPILSYSQLTEDEEAIAQFYRKKLAVGMPVDAVRHKMIQDGVDAKIVAAVTDNDNSPELIRTDSQLTEDEEAIAKFYRKKLAIGMPVDAVRHKMIQDGVDAKILAAVIDNEISPEPIRIDSQLTEDEEAIAKFYRKKLAVGMPTDAVRHKMVQDCVDAKIVAAVIGDDLDGTSSKSSNESTYSSPVPTIPVSATHTVIVNKDEDSSPSTLTHIPMSDAELAAMASYGKFAVKVDEDENVPSPERGEPKFMTLEQIARVSVQSKGDLTAMIESNRHKKEGDTKFVLESIPQSESVPVYAVGLPATSSATMAQATEGQEIVDAKLANAARAVSALGDGDMAQLLAKLQAGDIGDLLSKLQEAEKRQKKLEKQLAQAGVAIAEDIDYGEAKSKVEQIAKRMNEIGGSDVVAPDKVEQNKLREEYFKLEQEMERYNTALMLTEEYQAEQDRQEKKWESDNAPGNIEALKKIRRHMPVTIRHLSEADLTNNPTPNGKFLPKAFAKKFKRTNVLQLLRINPDDVERMHPSTLENMRVTGLTLTERRALYWHLKPLGPKWEKNKAEKMTERKWTWYTMMKTNFKENLTPYLRHCEEFGPPENHSCNLIGKQCPVKGDLLFDYSTDYGYTDADEYEVSDVRKADVDDPGAKAMQEALELARKKKANERADILKKHYKGKLLQVSKANGSCETMDDTMYKIEAHIMKWIEFVIEKGENTQEDDQKKEIAHFTEALNEFKLVCLDFAQRSGMQVSGKKKVGGDVADPRSSVEASLSDEVNDCCHEMFTYIKRRIDTHEINDTRVLKTIELLEGIMGELHARNVLLLKQVEGKRPDRSRKPKKIADLRKEVEDKMKPKEKDHSAAAADDACVERAPSVRGGRNDLMSAIQGRGGRGVERGGRGDLLSAISARGRGRGRGSGNQSRGDDAGRGGLLAAIQGRGGAGPVGSDGGRGGLMAAIQARGAGRSRGDGGRGNLLLAIQARSGGGVD